MRKYYLVAAMAIASLVANAQERMYLNTYNDTNIEKYDGKTCDVSTNRMTFQGWNTIALPFALTEQELNDVFGADCRLEKLVGVVDMGSSIQLNFQDCKRQGLQANTPYILYYSGENMSKRIAKQALVTHERSELTYAVGGGSVSMVGVEKRTDGNGLYGVLAADNAEAKFVKVDGVANGFYPTRCYIQLSEGNHKTLTTVHLAAGEVTSIAAIAAADDIVDVYNTAGMRVASQIRAAEVSKLQKGIYVVNGQKFLVK